MHTRIPALVASSSVLMLFVLGILRMGSLAIGLRFRTSILRVPESSASRERTCRSRTFDEKTSAICGIGHVYFSGPGLFGRTANCRAFRRKSPCQKS